MIMSEYPEILKIFKIFANKKYHISFWEISVKKYKILNEIINQNGFLSECFLYF